MGCEGKIEDRLVAQRHRGRPELVSFTRAERSQTKDQRPGALGVRSIARVRQYPNQRVFSERTCRPTTIAVVREPVMCQVVMHVVRLEEGDQHIRVEKDRSAHGSSSRRSFTNFMVSLGSPGARGGSKGTPFRTLTFCRAGVRPFRASSDSTFPAVLPSVAAISLAA